MKGVLIVGHGSRRKETELVLKSVVDKVRQKLSGTPTEIAYMEFGEPNIPAGLNALVEIGVDEIVVVPYFLFDGVHIRDDIPQILEDYKKVNPNIKLKMGNPLGEDPRLAEILIDRIEAVI